MPRKSAESVLRSAAPVAKSAKSMKQIIVSAVQRLVWPAPKNVSGWLVKIAWRVRDKYGCANPGEI